MAVSTEYKSGGALSEASLMSGESENCLVHCFVNAVTNSYRMW